MKRFLIPLLLCFPMILWGQKKTITQAKDYIKSGKNLNQAEKLLTDLLNDSSSRSNEKLWILLFEAQRKQYEQGKSLRCGVLCKCGTDFKENSPESTGKSIQNLQEKLSHHCYFGRKKVRRQEWDRKSIRTV